MPRVLLLSLLLLVSTARGQDAPPPQVPTMRINVNVEDADLVEVMDYIGREVSATIRVDPGVEERLSVSLQDIPWREALAVIANMTRCELIEEDYHYRIARRVRLTLAFDAAPATQALQTVASFAGETVIALPGLDGLVQLDLSESTCDEALRAICDQLGAEIADLGDLYVVGPSPLPAWTREMALEVPDWLQGGERVDLDLDGVGLRDACAQLALRAGHNVVVDPAVEERVSASLRAIPWRDALRLLAEWTGCQVELGPGGTRVLVQPALVTLDADELDGAEALRLIAAYSGFSLVLGPRTAGTPLTLSAKEIAGPRLLQVIAHVLGLEVAQRGTAWVVARRIPRALQRPLEAPPSGGEPVDLEVEAESVRQICGRIRDQLQVDVRVDRALDGRELSLSLKALPWRDALSLIARLSGARIRESQGGIVALTLPPRALVEANDAPLAQLLPLLAEYAGRELNLPVKLPATVDCHLTDLPWLTALELIAGAQGYPLGRLEQGGLELGTRDPAVADDLIDPLPLVGEPAPAPSAPPASQKRAPRAAPPVDRQQLATQLEVVLMQVVQFGQERKHEELVRQFEAFRTLLDDGGQVGIEEGERLLAKWAQRLAELGEVELSLQLQLDVTAGNQALSAMAAAIRDERYEEVHKHHRRLERRMERMRGEKREVFHRNADALWLRGESLADQAERLSTLSALEIDVSATVTAFDGDLRSAAVINGRVVREGDPVLQRGSDQPLEDLTVVEIDRWSVTLRYQESVFVRELGR